MPVAQALRSAQSRLVRLAERDLEVVWIHHMSTPEDATRALKVVLPSLIRTYGQAASTVAAQWYNAQRSEINAAGSFLADPIDIGDSGAPELVDWATRSATGADQLKTLIIGGMSRRVMDWSRQTVMGSATRDPASRGWQRVGVGACAFCQMLISRGAVYSESTADFASHDHCNCSAVVAWKDEPQPVKEYTPSSRHSEADQARAKAWIRDNL